MSDVDLSRRVGRLAAGNYIDENLSRKEIHQFMYEVSSAGSFSDLPKRTQDLIIAAEEELETL